MKALSLWDIIQDNLYLIIIYTWIELGTVSSYIYIYNYVAYIPVVKHSKVAVSPTTASRLVEGRITNSVCL